MATKKKFYAYFLEDSGKKGIAESWDECKEIVEGKKAKYKGFESEESAIFWLDNGADYSKKQPIALEDGIYFDSGTGAGNGVEINVTNKTGQKLLYKVLDEEHINEKGHHFAKKGATNNFGELLACKYALEIALQEDAKKIFGDSRLVIDFWSKGHIKKELGEETIELANKVKLLRKKFEAQGGQMLLISGGSNPADLGFHK